MAPVDIEFKSGCGLGAMVRGRVAPVIRGKLTAELVGRMEEAGFPEGLTDSSPATRACKGT